MRYSCALLSALLLLSGCNRLEEPLPQLLANPGAPLEEIGAEPLAIAGEVVGDFIIGEPVRYAKLTVFPIYSRDPKTSDRFITLDEGLASGKVEIREVPATEDPFSGDIPPADAPAADAPAESEHFGEEAPPADAPAGDDPFGDAPATEDVPGNDPSTRDTANNASADFEELTELISQEVQASTFGSEGAEESEVGGGDVNHLLFINSSERPLYLMPGELIIGGKQDRTIARETIVPPGGKPVEVEVFCVEQGRWSHRTQEELHESIVAAGGGNANERALAVSVAREFVAEDANANSERNAKLGYVDLKSREKFVASFGSISSVARRAVQEASEQGAVWEQVEQECQRAGTSSPSGAFTANYVDPEMVQAIGPYMKELGTRVSDRLQVVGVLVAIGPEIKTVDVFESTPLFKKMWPKLLKSFAFDALAAEEEANGEASEEANELASEQVTVEASKQAAEQAAPTKQEFPTLADARRCLEMATQSEVQEIKTADGLTMTRRKTDEMVSFSVHDEEAYRAYGGAGGGMGGGGGFGGAVHGGGFY